VSSFSAKGPTGIPVRAFVALAADFGAPRHVSIRRASRLALLRSTISPVLSAAHRSPFAFRYSVARSWNVLQLFNCRLFDAFVDNDEKVASHASCIFSSFSVNFRAVRRMQRWRAADVACRRNAGSALGIESGA
jgi:hypothetical protein